jgi:DNA-binding NtrC family response regulator
MEATAYSPAKPKLLFVDDEQRVLNSMRIMFRRDFDLYLACHGDDALQIIKDQDIDVIVADHRMPRMTGVEVLSQVRVLSPRTVRILLTGYADLDAVEGSINDGEVFRFLTKPCPPKDLRETIRLAATLAQTDPATAASDDTPIRLEKLPVTGEPAISGQARGGIEPGAETPSPVLPGAGAWPSLSGTTMIEAARATRSGTTLEDSHVLAQPPMPAPEPRQAQINEASTSTGLGVVVFSTDETTVDIVRQAVRSRLPVHHASSIVQVVRVLTEHRPGALVTDISEDRHTIQKMTASLKEHLPELVTIAVSEHRDVLDMVWLINHGQIFRFLRKPLSPGRCALSLEAALKHHRMLLRHPELVARHEVARSADGPAGVLEGMLERLKSVRKLWASA